MTARMAGCRLPTAGGRPAARPACGTNIHYPLFTLVGTVGSIRSACPAWRHWTPRTLEGLRDDARPTRVAARAGRRAAAGGCRLRLSPSDRGCPVQTNPPPRTAGRSPGGPARRVRLASPLAFCAGLERASDIVERTLDRHGPPVYVRRHIVHNNHVVRRLEGLGAVFVHELDEVPCGATVVYSAHGVSPAVRAEAAARGLTTVDATCPLVAKVHSQARRFVRDDRSIVFVGHAGHEEAEGAMGEAPGAFHLVQGAEDAERVEVEDPARVAFLTQTTLAVDETAAVVRALRARFPGIQGRPRATSATRPATGRRPSARSPARPTWSWW